VQLADLAGPPVYHLLSNVISANVELVCINVQPKYELSLVVFVVELGINFEHIYQKVTRLFVILLHFCMTTGAVTMLEIDC